MRLIAFLALIGAVCGAFAVETIVFIRHGEKPDNGLGQLSCQGLNRALRIPTILYGKFGKPDTIFAPNPEAEKPDNGVTYAYIRPLATIEPTAIKYGLPVNLKQGFNDVAGMVNALSAPALHNSTVFVAWDHHELVDIVKELAKADKNIKVPKWHGDNFDSIYLLKIDWENNKYDFKVDSENLNGLSKECPAF